MLESISCNSCGAPLKVPESAKFVNCNHCGAQLAVKRNESVTFTEAISHLNEATEELAEQVDELSRQNEKLSRQNDLDNLARLWEVRKKEYMVSDKHGNMHLPDEGTAVLGGVIIVVFGAIWTGMAFSITSGAPESFGFVKLGFPAFGFLFMAIGVVTSIMSYNKAKDYRAAKRRYDRERRKILSK